MKRSRRVVAACVLAVVATFRPSSLPASQPSAARNVVIVTLDGFRWQEMFTGAGRDYFKKEQNGEPGAAEQRFWRPTAGERRSTLLPFVWSTVATRGQIFGDPSRQSRVHLDAAYRADRFIARIWEMLQSLPDYAGATALLVTTDHGRGATPADWTEHGRKPAAEETWIAVLGPGVPPLGVRPSVTATTAQVAATVAALVGEDFSAAVVKAAAPLPGIGRAR